MSQEKGEANHATFQAWASSKTDSDFCEYVYRGQLNRKEIAAECGFAKSALRQNPAIKDALERLENDLRARSVLPAIASPEPKKPPQRDFEAPQRRRDALRLNSLEQQNAALRAENLALKRKLEQYNLLEEMLAETGRLPR